MIGEVIFVTGIDTNIGKTYATGYLAKRFAEEEGCSVITQKLIQTGNSGISEDIITHRKIMGTGLLPEDLDGTTCPIVLSYPASPHLAAQIDKSHINLKKIQKTTATLRKKYDITLIEGAGGIMTPLAENYTTLDYIKEQGFPVFIVTSPRLGSINHTLMTLEMCRYARIEVKGVVYNMFNVEDELICEATREYIKGYIEKHARSITWIEIIDGTVHAYGLS
ncbi:MAG: dethiobiotin synthase [Prevotellaceae bacterium]|jgi:dethiobiotin synthetase|nr:dethiobiotin synthase [Prevotellaceae bacterium]